MTLENSITRSLTPNDAPVIKVLYDNSFSQLACYYGQKLSEEFLNLKIFSSQLYGSDCSLVQVSEDGQIKAALLANLKQYPNHQESKNVYLNLLIISQDELGLECGKQLLTNFSKMARLLGKSRAITSLLWSGMWPGVLSVDKYTRKVLQSTSGNFTNGEVFAQYNISDLKSNCKKYCRFIPSDINIRPYQKPDYEGLRQLLSQNFSPGWLYETLCKVDQNVENFNGIGLIHTYRPDDVFIVSRGGTICGFCVVQSVTQDNSSFFGPIGLTPEIRGKSIGHSLMLKAIEYLGNRGKKTTGLWTSELIYRQFYSKLGMKISMQTQHFDWSLDSNETLKLSSKTM